MIRMALGLSALLILAGCANPAEVARRQAQAEIAQCQSYGFERGTTEFGLCRMELAKMREQRQQAEDTALMGLAVSFYGGAFRPRPRVNMTCFQNGPFINCQ
jgi:hypothetical protein